MTAARGVCELCGHEVAAVEAACHPVTGWEAERGGGGANRILDRQRDDARIAHVVCVAAQARQRRAGTLGQRAFL